MLGPYSLRRVRALELRVHRTSTCFYAVVWIADDARLNDQPPKTTGKKVAPAPGSRKGTKTQKNPLFEARPKNFGIGAYEPCLHCSPSPEQWM